MEALASLDQKVALLNSVRQKMDLKGMSNVFCHVTKVYLQLNFLVNLILVEFIKKYHKVAELQRKLNKLRYKVIFTSY